MRAQVPALEAVMRALVPALAAVMLAQVRALAAATLVPAAATLVPAAATLVPALEQAAETLVPALEQAAETLVPAPAQAAVTPVQEEPAAATLVRAAARVETGRVQEKEQEQERAEMAPEQVEREAALVETVRVPEEQAARVELATVPTTELAAVSLPNPSLASLAQSLTDSLSPLLVPAMSGPWDGPTGTADGAGCGVSWSDAGAGMYVAVLQGVIYDTVLASPFVEGVATDDDGQIAGGPLPGAPAPTFIQQQTAAGYNLARLSSSKPIAKPSTYFFNSTAGQGVDIYILDTGVFVNHLQFAGRAKVGGNIGLGILDGNGHGTFCASVAAGNTYGVSKKANIVSIKTFTDSGGGTASNVVKAAALVFKLVKKSKRPSIISLSASFPANAALDAIVKKANKKGIHFVSAAGNAGADASAYSPARSPYSVTVGAIDAADTLAKYSNYGPVVSIFAGGTNVVGAFIGTTASSVTLSGTSMATPAISGLIAYFISTWGNAPPLVMADALTKAATPGSIKGLKGGSVNLVAGNCRAMNDTCFDWSKPGKYLPIPPPPPPPPNVTSSAAPPPPTSSAAPPPPATTDPAPPPPPAEPNAAYKLLLNSTGLQSAVVTT
ncbi:hypothetical protein JCM10213v2_004320 [Rhodosporidiobolus nylandii]